MTDTQYLDPLLKSIANFDINKSLLRDSNIFTLAGLSKTCSSLGNEFPALENTVFRCNRCWRNTKMLQATLPCSSIWYQTIPISVLDTAIPEPGIGSTDTWYLVSSSTRAVHWHNIHRHTYLNTLNPCLHYTKQPC